MTDPSRPAFARPDLPAGWDAMREAPPTTLWAAVAPFDLDDPQRFRANVVLTCDDTTGISFRDWQVASDEVLPRALDDFLLIDLEKVEVDGRPGGRRLAHHVDGSGRALTMEQWCTLEAARGWTLTATCETWTYDDLASAFAAMANTWRPVSGIIAAPDDAGATR